MIKTLTRIAVYHLYKRKFLFLGNGVKVNPTSEIGRKHLISIGDYSFIGKHCHISIVEPATLVIERYVTVSPYVKILGGDHDITTVGIPLILVNNPTNRGIRIEQDSMVGMDSMILKGVTIGEGAIIGAKSLVNKNVLPYTIAAGNPARMVKMRFSIEDLKIHMVEIKSKYLYENLLEEYKENGLL